MRRRRKVDAPVWRLVNCPHCEVLRGHRCVRPGGRERDGTHMARIKRAQMLRRPTKQLELFQLQAA